MFRSICFTDRVGIGPPIDIGFLAEATLFYETVHIVATPHTLNHLLDVVGPFVLYDYLADGLLTIHYQNDRLAIKTENTGSSSEKHEIVKMSAPKHAREVFLPKLFYDKSSRSGKGRVLGKRFAELIQPIDHNSFDSSLLKSALLDEAFLQKAVVEYCALNAPNYELSSDFHFSVEEHGDQLRVHTNLDFAALNQAYHKRVPKKHSSLSPAYMLLHLQHAWDDLHFSSLLNAEVATNPVNSIAFRLKLERIANSSARANSEIQSFSDLVFGDGNAIGEALLSGQRSFSEWRKVLHQAAKYREWLRNQEPEVGLIKAYYKEATKQTWAEKQPAKSIRWAVFTGLGALADAAGAGGVGTAAGLAVSGADAFLLDKLLIGWKPNQFIEGPLRQFVERRP